MRTARALASPEAEDACYHCRSQTVNKEFLFGPMEKEVMRRQLWQVADFCGVKIITYAFLSNHFHILVRLQKKGPISDEELLRRYRVLYPHPTEYQTLRIQVIESWLRTGAPEADAWRRRITRLMGNLAAFMKLFKMRFSIWYNKTHDRCGPLWMERFKSTYCENKMGVLLLQAAYIDLNCVRAGIASDPKDYRFCGYAEAVAGNDHLREQLAWIFEGDDWQETHSIYRQRLFGSGTVPKEDKASISEEDFQRVIKAGGQLPLGYLARHRVKYFTDGMVLGSQAFVETQLALYRISTGRQRRGPVKLLPSIEEIGTLAVMKGVRGLAIA
jgi:putative transposase